MIKVAITGGIASGKSLLLQHLILANYVIYSSDAIAHDVLKYEGKEEVVNYFGKDILNDDGEINRKALGKIVFNDLDKLNKLNEIVHPHVKKRIEQIMVSNPHLSIIFFEIPLLFESHMENMFDYTINVYCDVDTQIRRIVERDDRSVDEALKIIASQMPTFKRNELASYAINNSGSVEETYKELDKIIDEILSKE